MIVFLTGSVLHHLPELTAVLLAENLRAYPFAEGSKAVADKIELYLVGESTKPIELDIRTTGIVKQLSSTGQSHCGLSQSSGHSVEIVE